MNNNRKALKSGIWYTASNFLIRSIGFITTPIFTRLLSKADFGQYNNFNAWLSLFTTFITLNLGATLISARYDYENEFDSYILSILAFGAISGGIWVSLFILFPDYAKGILGLDTRYFLLMVIYIILNLCIDLYQVRERYYFEYKKSVAISLILSISTALLSVLLVYTLSDRLLGRILGTVLPVIIIGLLCFLYFLRNGKRIRVKYWKYALPIGLPYIPHVLSLTVLNSMDRVMITNYCGAESTALYSLAYTCGTIITLLATSINTAFSPWLGEKLNNNSIDEINRISKKYMLLFVYFSIGIMLVSPEILYILGGNDYAEAVYVLAPVSMGCICQYIYTMFVNIEQFSKKTVGMALGSVIAAVTNFALNLVFIPMYGYLAAAYTTLCGYVVLLIIHMIIVKKIGFGKVYDYKFVGCIVSSCILMMLAIILLYSHTSLRYSFIGVYIITLVTFALKKKNLVLSYIKSKNQQDEN